LVPAWLQRVLAVACRLRCRVAMDPAPPRRRSLRHPSSARRLLEDERGASLGEYLIAVGCIAIGGMAAFAVFGREVRDKALSQVECLFEGGACEGDNRVLELDGTRDDGAVTWKRTAPATPQPRSEEDAPQPTREDEAPIVVDSMDLPLPVQSADDLLRMVLDSPSAAADVAAFLGRDPRGKLYVPNRLAPALEAWALLQGQRSMDPATVVQFQRYVAERKRFMVLAGIDHMTPGFDEAFRREGQSLRDGRSQRLTDGRPLVPGARQTRRAKLRTRTSVRVLDDVALAETVSPRRRPSLVRWFDTEGLWKSDNPGNEAFRRAAKSFGFGDAEVDMILVEGAVPFVHLDGGAAVTEASLEAKVAEGKYARRVGGSVVASYQLDAQTLGRLGLARLSTTRTAARGAPASPRRGCCPAPRPRSS
jgi:hypothetical protein